MPHNVLHLLGTAQDQGKGIACLVGALASGLDPAKYKLHVWFLGSDGPLVKEFQMHGTPVRVFNWQEGAKDPCGAGRFLRALFGKRFAIIHLHVGGRSVRSLARWATTAKVIVHFHGQAVELDGQASARMLFRGADVAIVVSQGAAKLAADRQLHVVYPGVRIPSRTSQSLIDPKLRTGRILGTAGRLVPIKGIVYLIRALALLRADFPDVILEIAGAGPERMQLENEIQLLGLKDCVKFLGWRTDLDVVRGYWDVFVQPSLEEGFGVAALEAMADGLPIVASAVGGIPELVDDGRTGWLVPPGDPVVLASRLRSLLLDPVQRRTMGMAGQARAREHFSAARMVSAVSNIYDSLVR